MQKKAEVFFMKIKKALRLLLSVEFIQMVGVRGFEPPAFRSRTERSTKLSHTPEKVQV